MKIDIDYQITVMQAFKYGKKIEVSVCKNSWVNANNPNWNWAHYNYRIKDECPPKEKFEPIEQIYNCLYMDETEFPLTVENRLQKLINRVNELSK